MDENKTPAELSRAVVSHDVKTVTKSQRLTYLGRRAERWEAREAGADGLRTVFVRWVDAADAKNGGHEAGTVLARTIRGNDLKGTLVVVTEQHVVGTAGWSR